VVVVCLVFGHVPRIIISGIRAAAVAVVARKSSGKLGWVRRWENTFTPHWGFSCFFVV